METQQGPSGGTGGSATYAIPFTQQLVAISVHAGDVVDNIQFVFPGSSPSAGGGGGQSYPVFGVPPEPRWWALRAAIATWSKRSASFLAMEPSARPTGC